MKIYLAGSIQKGHEKNACKWGEEEISKIQKAFPGAQILNPAMREDDLTDQKSVFGRDMTQVFLSDAVFVDARERRGLGVGAEMMWAKFHQKPVVTLAPLNTHYHLEKTLLLGKEVEMYIHPFVFSLSDCIVSTVEEGVLWLQKEEKIIKGIDDIMETMRHYRDTQFLQDTPMKTLFEELPF